MIRFTITPLPYNKKRDELRCVKENLAITVINMVSEPETEVEKHKHNYVAIYDGRKTDPSIIQFRVDDKELPMTQTLGWNKDLLLDAIRFYNEEKGYSQAAIIKNAATGATLFDDGSHYYDAPGYNAPSSLDYDDSGAYHDLFNPGEDF